MREPQTQASQGKEGRHYCEYVYQLLSLLYCVLIPTECKQKPLALCFNTGQLFTAMHLSQIKSRRRFVHTPSLLWQRHDTLSACVHLTWHSSECFEVLFLEVCYVWHVKNRSTMWRPAILNQGSMKEHYNSA